MFASFDTGPMAPRPVTCVWKVVPELTNTSLHRIEGGVGTREQVVP